MNGYYLFLRFVPFFFKVTVVPHARYCTIPLYLLSHLLITSINLISPVLGYTCCVVLLLPHVVLNTLS
jgi:hypothetical protein